MSKLIPPCFIHLLYDRHPFKDRFLRFPPPRQKKDVSSLDSHWMINFGILTSSVP